jgi:hypothetical protein
LRLVRKTSSLSPLVADAVLVVEGVLATELVVVAPG